MVLSAFTFAVMNMIIRHVHHFPVLQLVFFRSVGSSLLGCFFIYRANISFLGTHRKLLLLRSFFGVTSMSLFYTAIQMMPVGTAVSLRYLSPVFATIFAIFLLREKVKPIQWLFFICAFIGVSLIKGFDPRISFLGLVVIMGAAVLSALVYTTIRMIGQRENHLVIVNYFMVISTLVGAVGCLFKWDSPVGIEWVYLCSLGILGFLAQIWMTKSLQAAETNLITPVKYSEAIFTVLGGWLVFGEGQNILALAGILLVICSLVANVIVKRSYSQESK